MYLALVCCLLFFFYYSYFAFSHLSAQCIQSEWVCFCWPRPTNGQRFLPFHQGGGDGGTPNPFYVYSVLLVSGPVFCFPTLYSPPLPRLRDVVVYVDFAIVDFFTRHLCQPDESWTHSARRHWSSCHGYYHVKCPPDSTVVVKNNSLTRCSFYVLTWNLDDFFIRSLKSLVIM